MMKRLTNREEAEDAARRIRELLDEQSEWLYAENQTSAQAALRRGEWEVIVRHERLLLSVCVDQGTRIWRITAWEWTNEKLRLEATRRLDRERATLELVARASARRAAETITDARLAVCARLAALACALIPGAKVEQAGLSQGPRRGQPGRYARIVLRQGRRLTAVSGPVVSLEPSDAEAFVSATLVWFRRIGEKADDARKFKLWLVVTEGTATAVIERCALLREQWRNLIEVYKLDDVQGTLMPVPASSLHELLAGAPRLNRPAQQTTSELAGYIRSLAPEAIDVMRAGHGETLRFHGLAFARVRRVMRRERVWFGIERGRRQELDESSQPQLQNLIDNLIEHRRHEAHDHSHALYAHAPESWLESLLRRCITDLDPGLVLSPLHTQLRTSLDARAGARPVDLVALRQDGRLVVIELKVSEDAAFPLQGADYWRRVEAHRRHGNLARSRLFDEKRLADQPPLVYLVAPLLRFHRAFHTLAQMVAPEIEMYRFDINEDWRERVRVMRRTRVNPA